MKSTKAKIILIILFAAIIVAMIFFVKKTKDEPETTENESTSKLASGETKESSLPDDNNTEEITEKEETTETTTVVTYEDIEFYGQNINTSVEDIDISNYKITDFEKFKTDLALLPNLNHIVMCDCGLSNEQMEVLMAKFPNIKFVWRLYLGTWSVRTDAVAFSTLKTVNDTYRLTDEDASVLKYCTDLVALDIGHACVQDISFLQYMPNLKILILVDQYEEDGSMALVDMSYLKYTPKLMYLEFFVNQVSDLSFLQFLPNLVDLNVSYNPISDPTYLLQLPQTIERLYLEHTRLSAENCELIKNTYPNAQVEYIGEGSIDHGWRSHPRYFAMIEMFNNNFVHELYK